MDTELVQQILQLVKLKFLKDFKVDATSVTYLECKGCIPSWHDLLATPGGNRKKVIDLFELLGGSPNSIDVLIKFFEEEQRTQPHLRKLLMEARDRVLTEAGPLSESNSAPNGIDPPLPGCSSDSRDLSFKLKEVHLNLLVTIILRHTIALEKWPLVMYSMIPSAVQQQKIKRLLNQSELEEAVRTTLQYYIGQGNPSPTMSDLIEKFLEKGIELERLAEELTNELENLRKL